jgi:CDP-glucose 4,6-dehydratase
MVLGGTFYKDRSVFVTGATGLLGSWLTKQLVKLGANVVILVRDWQPESELLRNGYYNKVRRVSGDIRDYYLLKRILAEYEVQSVFHLAAQTIVAIANHDPIGTLDQNIIGTAKVLEACRLIDTVEHVIVASSDKAYGDSAVLPYTEEMGLNGRHPYDVSKSCSDLVALTYEHTYDMPVAVTRCGNLYGGGDLNFSRLIPKTIKRLLNGQPPQVYGDGSMKRDYTYVEDAVDAYLTIGMKGCRGAYNVAGGEVRTILEVVDTIGRLISINIPPLISGEKTPEIDSQWLNIDKIKNIGWSPAFTMEQGLKKTIDWYREYFNG